MKDRRKRAVMVKFTNGKHSIWKAYDRDEYCIVRALSQATCKEECRRKGYVVKC